VTASLATLRYGTEKDASAFTNSVPMADNGDNTFTAVFPLTEAGEYYYSVEAVAGGKTLLFPNQAGASVRLDLVSPEAKYQPKQLTVSPGTDVTTVGMSWITDTDGLSAKLLYRVAGGSDWTTADLGEVETVELTGGRGTITSYSVDLTGLAPNTQYEYRAVTINGATSTPRNENLYHAAGRQRLLCRWFPIYRQPTRRVFAVPLHHEFVRCRPARRNELRHQPWRHGGGRLLAVPVAVYVPNARRLLCNASHRVRTRQP
jgi:plastocyanin